MQQLVSQMLGLKADREEGGAQLRYVLLLLSPVPRVFWHQAWLVLSVEHSAAKDFKEPRSLEANGPANTLVSGSSGSVAAVASPCSVFFACDAYG